MGGFLYKGFFERREGNGLETASFAIAPIVFFFVLGNFGIHFSACHRHPHHHHHGHGHGHGGVSTFSLQFDTIIIINLHRFFTFSFL